VSPTSSLADEKQALLAKMQASRVAYRRMLLGTDDVETVIDNTQQATSFPKSKTVRWIRDHPYLSLLAIGALVIGPRRIVRIAARRGKTATSMVIRNQNRVRAALGIVTAIARLIGRRRSR
jgi:hypothetical protein